MDKYRNFSLFTILIQTPDFPHFYYMLGGNLGSLLYGDVSVMYIEDKVEVSSIVNIPYTHTENALKNEQKPRIVATFL